MFCVKLGAYLGEPERTPHMGRLVKDTLTLLYYYGIIYHHLICRALTLCLLLFRIYCCFYDVIDFMSSLSTQLALILFVTTKYFIYSWLIYFTLLQLSASCYPSWVRCIPTPDKILPVFRNDFDVFPWITSCIQDDNDSTNSRIILEP